MITIPTSEIIMRWLQQDKIEHYVCDQCHGLHIVSLQSLDVVEESRIFIEDDGVLFSTELEIRPTALLPLMAELGRLNMEFPTLKIFLDIMDHNLPRLVAGHTLFTKAGLSAEQFLLFVNSTMAVTHQLIAQCEQLGFLNMAELGLSTDAVH